jgi:hypothetical protein
MPCSGQLSAAQPSSGGSTAVATRQRSRYTATRGVVAAGAPAPGGQAK